MTSAIGLELRPYQLDALAKTEAADRRGVRRQLGVAATGLGKTVMFAALAATRGGRTLILVHREELVRQAVAKVREIWPGIDVGVVKANENGVRATVVVASVQTLARKARMDQLLRPIEQPGMLGPIDPFDLVVIDEAHHAAATSYRSILDRLDAGGPPKPCTCMGGCIRCGNTQFLPPGPLLLGVTATPDRGDGAGLDDLFDEIVWSYDIRWGIRSGYLSDIRGITITIDDLDLDAVKVSRGDYQAGDAGRALTDAGAPDAIVAAWIEHALGRRTLVFTPTVDVARDVADAFHRAGVRAGWVSGETEASQRRNILAAYATGEIEVLANCAVLTEGFDEPRTDCVVIARPTKSRGLYTQMVGRGTRRHPDKTDCLVLDVVGASTDHSLVTIPSLFGVPPKIRRQLSDGSTLVGAALDEADRELVRVGKITAAEADMFRTVRADGIAWIAIHEPGDPMRRYHRPLGRDLPTVVLAERHDVDLDDTVWVAGLWHTNGTKEVLATHDSMELSQGVAEDYIRSSGAVHLTDSSRAWRRKAPTFKQRQMAGRYRIEISKDWNAGQLADAIDQALERRKVSRPRR